MARIGSARRHAQAVFALALEAKALDRWQKDLRTLRDQMSQGRVLAWLESPKVRLQDKLAWAHSSLKGVSPLAVNLAGLLILRGRVRLLPDIEAEFDRLVDAHHGIERGQVATAIPLKDAERKHLAQGLSSVLQKKLRLTFKVEAHILGGFVARVGDRVVDGSVRSTLLALRRSLLVSR